MAEPTERRMTMKKAKTVLWLLIIGTFLVTALFIAAMPDSVPMHYNAFGETDRWGSRFEYLLFPILSLIIGICGLMAGKKLKNCVQGRVFLLASLCIDAGLLAMTFFYLWKAQSISLSGSWQYPRLDIVQITTIMVGLLLIVLGNLMPKATRNSLFGLRTIWSTSSDEVWRRCQRFGGITAVALGLMLVVMGLTIRAQLLLCGLMVGLTLAWGISCGLGSYVVCKRVNGCR